MPKKGKKPSKTPCVICRDPRRQEMEFDMLAGISYRELETKYGIDHLAFFRHKQKNHIMKEVIEAVGKQKIDEAFELVSRAKTLYDLAVCAARRAIKSEQFQAAGNCIVAGQKVLETMSITVEPKTGSDPVKDSPFMQAYFKRSGEIFAEKEATATTEEQPDKLPLEAPEPQTRADPALVDTSKPVA